MAKHQNNPDEPTIGKRGVQVHREHMSTTHQKDCQMDTITLKLLLFKTLLIQIEIGSVWYIVDYTIYASVKHGTVTVLMTINITPLPHHHLPEEENIIKLYVKIMDIVKKFYPCTKDNNHAALLLDFLRDGSIYGEDGVAAMKEIHFSVGKEMFLA